MTVNDGTELAFGDSFLESRTITQSEIPAAACLMIARVRSFTGLPLIALEIGA
jgi:hypothetical protein